MDAEVISIGDELTTGQRLDTNSQWLSQQLSELGVRVLYHTTVGDDLSANERVFRQAFERADLIVTTGGLGPTADDLTRDALALATGRELLLNESALSHIRALFARRKREMPQRNEVQAMFPRGSRVVPNPHGSAPGIELEIERENRQPVRFFALPGVPAEMVEMWRETVVPAIQNMLGDKRRVIRVRTIKCFGVGESDLEAMLPDLIRRGRTPTVGITVSRATISLRIIAEGSDEMDCLRQIEPTVETIHRCLGTLVFGEADEELSHAVIRILGQRQVTLATAESGSGGLLADWLSEADITRRHFVGGFVRRVGGYSTADEVNRFAEETRLIFATDLALAIGDFPESDSPNAPAGNVHISLARHAGTESATYPYTGHPDILKHRTLKLALNFIRLRLLRENDQS